MLRMLFLVSLAAAALAGCGSAAATPESGNLRDKFGRQTPYALPPTEMNTEQLVPPGVLATHSMQTSEVRCRIGPRGTLTECQVTFESIASVGMCEATLKAASLVRLKPRFPDGEPLEGLYAALVFVFDVGGSAPPYRILPGPIELSREPIGAYRRPFAQSSSNVREGCDA